MKACLFALFMLALTNGAVAQENSAKKVRFSVGPEVGLATSDFNKTHSVGIGATGQIDGRIATDTYITLTSGYMSYAGRSAGSGIKYKAAGIIPLKGGVKYFFTEAFYSAAQIGVGFFSNGGGTAFAYTPMLGYEFNSKSGTAIDASLKYDGYSMSGSTLGSLGLRVAFRF